MANIQTALEEVADSISLPSAIVERHAGVNAIGLQKLLDSFALFPGDPETLLPAPAESDDAYDRMVSIMERINVTLYPAFLPDKRVPLHALVVIEWLKGYSLAQIIAARIRYHEGHKHSYSLPALLRETMELVERTARFRAPKYLAAYMDVLRHHLRGIGREDLIEDDLDLGVALEYGLSTKTLLSLMELGLSRMSAVGLSEKIARDDLDQAGCRAWVAEHEADLEVSDLPAVVWREVRQKLLGIRADGPSYEA
jgi:hypothetical protein